MNRTATLAAVRSPPESVATSSAVPLVEHDPLADLLRASEKDPRAKGQLIRALAPRVLAAVRAIIGPKHPDVEDLAQESLVAVVRALEGFRGECSIAHFATRITLRRTWESRRRLREDARRLDVMQQEQTTSAYENRTIEREPNDESRRQIVRQLVEDLPDAQAETMMMRVVMGHSLEEIAEMTEVPVNTVRSRLRLAKEALRKRIEDDRRLMELLGVEL